MTKTESEAKLKCAIVVEDSKFKFLTCYHHRSLWSSLFSLREKINCPHYISHNANAKISDDNDEVCIIYHNPKSRFCAAAFETLHEIKSYTQAAAAAALSEPRLPVLLHSCNTTSLCSYPAYHPSLCLGRRHY
jgi:hypothetical protein